ncbi:GNAT family N-acetyltransferase [Algoriphagus vanfongensis]|uniref:GNAT family N-acetyltransferase n=1 Tax=Algoriphagus vanfongensis TaxID=426371 RepID=UPI0004115E69|nr:GNAT family N-acetyltransferase [Algoriphagus vanfongensis]
MISYQIEKEISLEEYISILESSTLSKRRPMENHSQLRRMISGSNLIITARSEGKLVGLLRALSDFSFRCFIADLAVDASYQKQGIGKTLLQEARNSAEDARLFLFAAETAIPFYHKLGFYPHNHCFQLKPEDKLL